jgi:hypothetical protein
MDAIFTDALDASDNRPRNPCRARQLAHGATLKAHCPELKTHRTKQNANPVGWRFASALLLLILVAGAGFEPTTFGL